MFFLYSTLIDLLLLVHAQLAGAHVDQEKETTTDPRISLLNKNTIRESETYTMERIWKKSYLAKSLCGW